MERKVYMDIWLYSYYIILIVLFSKLNYSQLIVSFGVDILRIVWMMVQFPCRVISL